MGAVDNTAASAYLKQRFSRKRIQNLSYAGSPLFAMIPKDESFGGENLKCPVSYADLKGSSATFSVAQANKAASDTVAFLLTTVEDYALFSIKGKTIKQSRGDMNAWLPALEKEAESAVRALGRRTSMGLYRDKVGGIGRCDTTSGTTITLGSAASGDRADVQNFEKGMKVYFANPTGPALRDSGETLTISAIDRDAGTLTVSANLSTISGLTADDYVIPEGDFNIRLSGLAAWVPSSAPDATAFFNVDRSVDTVRLGGIRFDAAGMNIEEAVINASARAGENGATPDKLFLNFDKWRELGNFLGGKKEYHQGTSWAPEGGPKADVGFAGYRVYGPSGAIEVYPDRHAQAKAGWMTQTDTLGLHSTGPVPQMLEEDGNSILREATDDAYEGRWGCYFQVGCNAPGYNSYISNL